MNDAFHDDYIKNNEIISAKKIGNVIENVIKQSTVIIIFSFILNIYPYNFIIIMILLLLLLL